MMEAKFDYETDLKELDSEIDTIDDMIKIRFTGLDRQY
jgi:hypothetical protein